MVDRVRGDESHLKTLTTEGTEEHGGTSGLPLWVSVSSVVEVLALLSY
jgi:hypothetical protein